ncbi:SubName: Full=Probable TOM40-mitochondrial import receptor (MOM38) {ECO:0000313/EMBL:CCA68912.1} [Serendipita indica DSM 11827]|nr:SubName: Full=Probable TOM40-mitochondrial import receptor (MOM38) {ECO:0000313/EMBL:CCA68912.1} [Serendipita indica DSM 11827]
MSFNLPPKPASPGFPISTLSTSSDESPGPLSFAFAPAINIYNRFWSWRTSLDLPNPGSVENLQKEIKSTQLTNFMFDGLRADYTKAFSHKPAFTISHAFTLASQTQDPTYTLSSIYYRNVDHEGNGGRLTHQWTPSHDKGPIAGQPIASLGSAPDRSFLQLEHENSGVDYCLNLKAINPSPIDGSGIYSASLLQSVSKRLALGIETNFQSAPDGSDTLTTWHAKYTGRQNDWIATASFHTLGLLQASYWHKLSPQVEVAADLQLIATPMKRRRGAVGAKWDLRLSSFKAQLDSTGEIDHFKNTAKVRMGIMLEANAAPYDEEMMASLPPQL